MRDLSRRSDEPEWLDEAAKNPDELALVLHDLARFNGAMLGHWPVLAWLRRQVRFLPKDPTLTLVDVGCGYGDLLRSIRSWGRKRGITIRLIGIDSNQDTIRIAQSATRDDDDIDYRAMDVFDFNPREPVDFIISSLVTHHMPDAVIVKFLGWMEACARKGWMIYDLQRHPIPLHFIGLMGRLTRLHPIVIHDGQISVARSLTRTEWFARLSEASIPLDAVQLRWFLFRFVIGRTQ